MKFLPRIFLAITLLSICTVLCHCQKAPPSSSGAQPGRDDTGILKPLEDARKAAILEAFRTNPEVRVQNLAVEVRGVTVTISGTVASPQQKTDAETLVRRVPGVEVVDNRIQVSSR
ncbi:MAG: BON domain-containing protein [Armatimonadetes bacterium]|nr:BON domain-containing protein [Armatimonadota bacterium]